MLAHDEYQNSDIHSMQLPLHEQFFIHETVSTLLPRTDPIELALHQLESNQMGYSVMEYQVKLCLTVGENHHVGGLTLTRQWEAAHLTSIFVSEEVRGRSLGSQLLIRAEQISQELGCQMVMLETSTLHHYQFYLNRGYHVASSIENYMPGHTYFQLIKQF
jgi:GNAT superfamily N-acetyltransferase